MICKETQQKIVMVILILSMIAMFAIPTFCQPVQQILKKTVAFETVQKEIFFNGKHTTDLNQLLIEFRNGYIITDGDNQTMDFHLETPWEDNIIKEGDPISLKSNAIDHGGFKCLLNFGYEKKVDMYYLWVSYKNVSFCYWLKPSNKEMWDVWDEWAISKGHNVPSHIEYTPEQLQEFWSNFSFLYMDFISLSWLN